MSRAHGVITQRLLDTLSEQDALALGRYGARQPTIALRQHSAQRLSQALLATAAATLVDTALARRNGGAEGREPAGRHDRCHSRLVTSERGTRALAKRHWIQAHALPRRATVRPPRQAGDR
jgi:hypothetical protein